jgi:5-methylthioadenosine/S-adenosylhomocysteine deaminase
MPTLLIRNATLDDKSINIFCEDGLISAIDGEDHPADEILDANGMIAFPPLINAHTHSSMTLFRGNGDDLPLMEWLTQRVWPYERGITAEEIYWGAKLAIVEMIRNGTVFFNDMYWDFHAVARAVEEMGVRANLASAIIDITYDTAKRAEQYERIERDYKDSLTFSDRINLALGPHATYTVFEESFRWAADFAKEHDLILHTHLSETEKEVTDCIAERGCTQVEYMHRLGALDARFVAAHTVWLSDSDIALMGEYNVVCVHNPVSNMKLAVNGVYPYRKLQDAGAITAIATDGAGSNNNLDMFEEMKIAALLQKFHQNDPTALTAVETLDMAIHNSAEFFGLGGKQLEVGRQADFILIDPSLPEMNPPHDLASHLAYAANGNVVDSVVCDGRVLMKHREIEGMEEIVAKANEAARILFARVDEA